MMSPYHLVWHVKANLESMEYFVVVELRDYQRNYVRAMPVNKDWIMNLLKAMTMNEEKGYKYLGDGVGTFTMGGLEK